MTSSPYILTENALLRLLRSSGTGAGKCFFPFSENPQEDRHPPSSSPHDEAVMTRQGEATPLSSPLPWEHTLHGNQSATVALCELLYHPDFYYADTPLTLRVRVWPGTEVHQTLEVVRPSWFTVETQKRYDATAFPLRCRLGMSVIGGSMGKAAGRHDEEHSGHDLQRDVVLRDWEMHLMATTPAPQSSLSRPFKGVHSSRYRVTPSGETAAEEVSGVSGDSSRSSSAGHPPRSHAMMCAEDANELSASPAKVCAELELPFKTLFHVAHVLAAPSNSSAARESASGPWHTQRLILSLRFTGCTSEKEGHGTPLHCLRRVALEVVFPDTTVGRFLHQRWLKRRAEWEGVTTPAVLSHPQGRENGSGSSRNINLPRRRPRLLKRTTAPVEREVLIFVDSEDEGKGEGEYETESPPEMASTYSPQRPHGPAAVLHASCSSISSVSSRSSPPSSSCASPSTTAPRSNDAPVSVRQVQSFGANPRTREVEVEVEVDNEEEEEEVVLVVVEDDEPAPAVVRRSENERVSPDARPPDHSNFETEEIVVSVEEDLGSSSTYLSDHDEAEEQQKEKRSNAFDGETSIVLQIHLEEEGEVHPTVYEQVNKGDGVAKEWGSDGLKRTPLQEVTPPETAMKEENVRRLPDDEKSPSPTEEAAGIGNRTSTGQRSAQKDLLGGGHETSTQDSEEKMDCQTSRGSGVSTIGARQTIVSYNENGETPSRSSSRSVVCETRGTQTTLLMPDSLTTVCVQTDVVQLNETKQSGTKEITVATSPIRWKSDGREGPQEKWLSTFERTEHTQLDCTPPSEVSSEMESPPRHYPLPESEEAAFYASHTLDVHPPTRLHLSEYPPMPPKTLLPLKPQHCRTATDPTCSSQPISAHPRYTPSSEALHKSPITIGAAGAEVEELHRATAPVYVNLYRSETVSEKSLPVPRTPVRQEWGRRSASAGDGGHQLRYSEEERRRRVQSSSLFGAAAETVYQDRRSGSAPLSDVVSPTVASSQSSLDFTGERRSAPSLIDSRWQALLERLERRHGTSASPRVRGRFSNASSEGDVQPPQVYDAAANSRSTARHFSANYTTEDVSYEQPVCGTTPSNSHTLPHGTPTLSAAYRDPASRRQLRSSSHAPNCPPVRTEAMSHDPLYLHGEKWIAAACALQSRWRHRASRHAPGHCRSAVVSSYITTPEKVLRGVRLEEREGPSREPEPLGPQRYSRPLPAQRIAAGSVWDESVSSTSDTYEEEEREPPHEATPPSQRHSRYSSSTLWNTAQQGEERPEVHRKASIHAWDLPMKKSLFRRSLSEHSDRRSRRVTPVRHTSDDESVQVEESESDRSEGGVSGYHSAPLPPRRSKTPPPSAVIRPRVASASCSPRQEERRAPPRQPQSASSSVLIQSPNELVPPSTPVRLQLHSFFIWKHQASRTTVRPRLLVLRREEHRCFPGEEPDPHCAGPKQRQPDTYAVHVSLTLLKKERQGLSDALLPPPMPTLWNTGRKQSRASADTVSITKQHLEGISRITFSCLHTPSSSREANDLHTGYRIPGLECVVGEAAVQRGASVVHPEQLREVSHCCVALYKGEVILAAEVQNTEAVKLFQSVLTP